MGMDFGYRVGKLTGKLQILVFAGAATISLFGQVVWDDAPAATSSAFKDDFVNPLISGALSDPTRLSLAHDSRHPKPQAGTAPAASVSVRADRETGGFAQPIARKAPTRKHEFETSGTATTASVGSTGGPLVGRWSASGAVTGGVASTLAGNASSQEAKSLGGSLSSDSTPFSLGRSLSGGVSLPDYNPTPVEVRPVQLGHEVFAGRGSDSLDPESFSAASSLNPTGLSTSSYSTSGELSPGTSAQTVYIGFEAEIHTGNNVFSIHNTSTAGIRISQVVVNLLGGNIQVDTAPGGAAFDPLDKTLAVADGISAPTIVNKHFTGGPFPAGYTTTTSAAVGYTGTLISDIPDGGRVLTFNFTDFDRHEAWGFHVDYDLMTANDKPVGEALNGVSITVTFRDAVGNTDSLTYIYSGNRGKKVSFPTDIGDHMGPLQPSMVLIIPEPPTLAAALLLAGFGFFRICRRWC
jgi:hypothetical protein